MTQKILPHPQAVPILEFRAHVEHDRASPGSFATTVTSKDGDAEERNPAYNWAQVPYRSSITGRWAPPSERFPVNTITDQKVVSRTLVQPVHEAECVVYRFEFIVLESPNEFAESLARYRPCLLDEDLGAVTADRDRGAENPRRGRSASISARTRRLSARSSSSVRKFSTAST
jgi:hypothetical protein